MENNNPLPVTAPDEKSKDQVPPAQPPNGYYANPFSQQPSQPGQPGQMNIGNLHYGYHAHPGGYLPPNPNGYQPLPNNLSRQPAAAEQTNEVELGARKVDQQLESGWFDCYKRFLMLVGIYAIVRASSEKDISVLTAYVCGKFGNYMVVGFVLFIQFAYHKKEVSKAKWAMVFAYIACVLQIARCWGYLNESGDLDPLNTTGEKELNVASGVGDVCFVIFACVIPGGKVRDLLEKRLPALDAIPDPPLVEPEAFDI